MVPTWLLLGKRNNDVRRNLSQDQRNNSADSTAPFSLLRRVSIGQGGWRLCYVSLVIQDNYSHVMKGHLLYIHVDKKSTRMIMLESLGMQRRPSVAAIAAPQTGGIISGGRKKSASIPKSCPGFAGTRCKRKRVRSGA